MAQKGLNEDPQLDAPQTLEESGKVAPNPAPAPVGSDGVLTQILKSERARTIARLMGTVIFTGAVAYECVDRFTTSQQNKQNTEIDTGETLAPVTSAQPVLNDSDNSKINEKAEALKKQPTSRMMATAVNSFRDFFQAPTSELVHPVYFMDPYNGFKTVGKLEMAVGLPADQVQAAYDAKRAEIAKEYPEIFTSSDAGKELPLAMSLRPEVTLDAIVDNGMAQVKKGKTVIDVVKDSVDLNMVQTNFYKYLVDRNKHDDAVLRKELKAGIDLLNHQLLSLKAKKDAKGLARTQIDLDALADQYNATIDHAEQKKFPYVERFKHLLVYGLVAQESGYQNLTSGANARGLWQMTEPALDEVREKFKMPLKHVNYADIAQDSMIGVGYMDVIFGHIRADVENLAQVYGIKDVHRLMMPCVITSYNTGHGRIRQMVKWFAEQQNQNVIQGVKDGSMTADDLFLTMTILFFHYNKFDQQTLKDQGVTSVDGFGRDGLQYYPKIVSWASMIPNAVVQPPGKRAKQEMP